MNLAYMSSSVTLAKWGDLEHLWSGSVQRKKLDIVGKMNIVYSETASPWYVAVLFSV